jgi:competence CoiA-like predicted nuclease
MFTNMIEEQPQTLSCPVCGTQVLFTVGGLLRGERFACPKCDSVISLSAGSKELLEHAVVQFDKLASGKLKG